MTPYLNKIFFSIFLMFFLVGCANDKSLESEVGIAEKDSLDSELKNTISFWLNKK